MTTEPLALELGRIGCSFQHANLQKPMRNYRKDKVPKGARLGIDVGGSGTVLGSKLNSKMGPNLGEIHLGGLDGSMKNFLRMFTPNNPTLAGVVTFWFEISFNKTYNMRYPDMVKCMVQIRKIG